MTFRRSILLRYNRKGIIAGIIWNYISLIGVGTVIIPIFIALPALKMML
jgi:hypothetical protein